MTLLLDEMYSRALAEALRASGLDAVTAAETGLSGLPDSEGLIAASRLGRALLTENVSDFARIAAEYVTGGHHHAGVLIALSSRFSRRASGVKHIVAGVKALGAEPLDNRVLYLRRQDQE